MSDLNVHCDVKKGGFPLNSGPALPLPAARGRCGPFSAEVQRHAAAAAVRSEAAECRELQLLRSVYFHWPSASGIHSSRSELLLGSVRTGSVHTIPPFVRPGICAREGQTHRFLISGPDNFSSFLIIYPLPDFFFLLFLAFHHREGYSCLEPSLVSVAAGVCFHARCVPLRRQHRNTEVWGWSNLWSGCRQVWYLTNRVKPSRKVMYSLWGGAVSHHV